MTSSDDLPAPELPASDLPVAEARPSIRLDIFSDLVCPWCYVGKLNLDRALAERRDHPFSILWHPFRLNPEIAEGGVDKRAWLEEKLGGKERLDAVHERLREVARKAGVALDPDRPTRIPDTLDAHRLIHWAGIEGRQQEVVSALFRAYWDEGRDIGEAAVLAEIAGACGMDKATVARLLETDADREDLIARDLDARRKGVNSVPTFLIAQHYVVSGAQPPEFWGEVVKELHEKAEEETP